MNVSKRRCLFALPPCCYCFYKAHIGDKTAVLFLDLDDSRVVFTIAHYFESRVLVQCFFVNR